MVNLVCLLAQAPSGLWERIISLFNSAFGNYAVAIIMITLAIKLILFPADYFSRRSSAKMTEHQTKLQPKINNIKKKYPDKNVQNQKINELYNKEGFNPLGSCLATLISTVITTVVFITLFSSLNNMASYKIVDQYEQLQEAYVEAKVNDASSLSQDEINQLVIDISESGNTALISKANDEVKKRYKEVKESFLWIKNVWIADSPTQRAIPSFEKYASLAKLSFENTEEGKAKKLEAEKIYNAVMGDLEKQQGVNGYFLLSILAAGTAFLHQYLLTRKKQSKQKNEQTNQNDQTPQPQSGKTMLFVLPALMLVFTLSYTSVFSLYIIVGQIFNLATLPLITYLLNIGKQKKVEVAETVIDIEPVKDTETLNNENKTNNTNKTSSSSNKKKNNNTKTKGKTIKYPKKTNKGV